MIGAAVESGRLAFDFHLWCFDLFNRLLPFDFCLSLSLAGGCANCALLYQISASYGAAVKSFSFDPRFCVSMLNFPLFMRIHSWYVATYFV